MTYEHAAPYGRGGGQMCLLDLASELQHPQGNTGHPNARLEQGEHHQIPDNLPAAGHPPVDTIPPERASQGEGPPLHALLTNLVPLPGTSPSLEGPVILRFFQKGFVGEKTLGIAGMLSCPHDEYVCQLVTCCVCFL